MQLHIRIELWRDDPFEARREIGSRYYDEETIADPS